MAAAGAPPRQATGRQAAALRLWIVARTVFLDELVLAACADGARQVVLLGAGFDTRAFRLPWPPGVRCFELDTQDVLDSKEQVLAGQHAVPGCERITLPGDLRDVSALAAITNLPGLERWGYLTVEPDPADQRAKPPRRDWVVRPTEAGQRAQYIWRPLTAEIEQRWRDRFGAGQITALTAMLRTLSRQTGLVLPPYLPVVGVYPADHGTWLAAGRQVGRGVSPRLPALLSHLLSAFAIDVERESPLTMVVGSGVLRVLGTDPVPVADLPLRAGLSKEAISRALGLLERHGYAVTEPDPAASRRKAARLTARGQRAQDDHHRLVAAVEQQWRGQFGADKVDGLANALRGLFAEAGGQQRIASGLVPYPGGWRAHPPYLSQTEAMLANPAAALPYYPMVSHRGGFPDGS